MKGFVAVLMVLMAGSVSADECKVERIVIKAQSLPSACSVTGRMRFRAVPINSEGRAVNVRRCETPQPSWGHSFPFAGLSPEGWYLWVEDVFPGDEVDVEAHLWVGEDLYSSYRTFAYQRPIKR